MKVLATIGNDEGDVYCSLCERKDWYQGLQMEREDGTRVIVCEGRYEGDSCTDLILAATFAKASA